MPEPWAALIASTACGIGPAPAYTTPSRSARIRSTPSSGVAPVASVVRRRIGVGFGCELIAGLVLRFQFEFFLDDLDSVVALGQLGLLERDRGAVGPPPPLLGLLGVTEILEHGRVGVE